MARIELLTEREQLHSDPQRELFDRIVASRGEMIRPYQVLAHAPAVAGAIGDVGAAIRFGGTLADHDRELVIITAAVVNDCQFEWDSHHPIALQAGVRPETAEYLRSGGDHDLDHRESTIIGYVRELCETGNVSDALFAQMVEMLGTEGTVELTATVGYYTMLAYVMNVAGAC